MSNQFIAALSGDEFMLERERSINFSGSTTNKLKPAMKWKVFFDWFFSPSRRRRRGGQLQVPLEQLHGAPGSGTKIKN